MISLRQRIFRYTDKVSDSGSSSEYARVEAMRQVVHSKLIDYNANNTAINRFANTYRHGVNW